MAVRGTIKERDVFREMHGGEHWVIVANVEQLMQAAEQIATVRRECNMRVSIMMADLEDEDDAAKTKSDVMKLLRSDDRHRLMILSEAGGLRDKDGRIIPLMTRKKLKEVMEGRAECIGELPRDVRHSLPLINNALGHIPNVTMSAGDQYLKESYAYMGAGTLFVNGKFTMKKMPMNQYPIFEAMNADHVRSDKFRFRSVKELQKGFRNHYALYSGDIPIGGASMIPMPGKTREFAQFWAEVMGQGIGKEIASFIPELAGDRTVYSITSDTATKSILSGCDFFDDVGLLAEARDRHDDRVPQHLYRYSEKRLAKKRPELFVSTPEKRQMR